MKKASSDRLCQHRAYTMIEALVASSVLLIGISAAASMSLAFVTQEETAERSARAFNHLENAVSLCQAGVDPATITSLLPPQPIVTSLTFTNSSRDAGTLTNLPTVVIQMEWKANDASSTSGTTRWTGGDRDARRTASVEVLRTAPVLAAPLPRVDAFD